MGAYVCLDFDWFIYLSIHSFCKGRTLYSVVRDSKLDINKIRQIAQEIVKVWSITCNTCFCFILNDSSMHVIIQRKWKKGLQFLLPPYWVQWLYTYTVFALTVCLFFCFFFTFYREWVTFMQRELCTKIWSPRMCFTIQIK